MSSSIRIIVLGSDGAGKSSLIRKYLGKGFRQAHHKTIGTEISQVNQIFHIGDYGKKVKTKTINFDFPIKIIEVASNHISNFIRKERSFTRNTGLILVFDVNKLDSYLLLTHHLVLLTETYPKFDLPIYIVGNKYENGDTQTRSQDDIRHYITTLREDKKIRSEFIGHSVISSKNDPVGFIFSILSNEIIKKIPFRKGKFILH